MLLLLLACATPPSPGDDPADTGADTSDTSDTSGGADTSDTSDSADTGDDRTPIAPGPDCTEDELPIDTPLNVLVGHATAGELDATELADLHRLVEEWMPLRAGPWQHQVRGPMISEDGVEFSPEAEDVLAAASVPDVAVAADGSLVMIHVDGDVDRMLALAEAGEPMPGGMVGLGGLAGATSDDGIRWTRVELQFDPPLPAFAVDPELQALPDGGWALYFLGIPAEELCADTPDPFGVPSAHRLYRATSEDLLHWRDAAPVYTAPAGIDPAVWCVDDTRCFGWFDGAIRSDDGGASWDTTDELSLPGAMVVPDVVVTPGDFRLFVKSAQGIDVFGSADGAAWTALGTTGAGPGSPTVVARDGQLWMWASWGLR